MIKVLNQENTILSRYVAQLRDEVTQRDPMRFRRNLERTGEVMAYEISKTLNYRAETVVTPLGEAEVMVPADEVVIASILRAGVPMHNGFLNVFDDASNAFVSAFRKYSKDGTMKVVLEQVTTPSLEGKVLIVVDPMLATGASIELAYYALIEKGGVPAHTHLASVISSTDGVEYVRKHFPMEHVTLWTAAVDEEMTVKSYIVPGIGDPGDLAYGKKL
ncbi:uracil phosphoribosyltransferase [uncultured Rikenella sp.]|uniref:uracil phosphoribosyltransferase n=1 Tax=uncultured Rikenella sp. TaxID=368003 RepID=UPI00260196A6|nr:uracil phosphoribosyltransferase [uncultured Rikenella sp.]